MIGLVGAIIGREEWKKLRENPAPLPPCPIRISDSNLELNDLLNSEKPVSNQLSCGMPSVCLFGFKA